MREDNQSLSKKQFDEIMQRILKNHHFYKGGKGVKYVRPNWDMRDVKCFFITFNCYEAEVEFSHNDKGNMHENIMNWLGEGEL